jgi:integrase
MAKTKQKAWSYLAGEKGRNRVRAFERNGRLYLEWCEGGTKHRLPLNHADTDRAKTAADKTAAEFAQLATLRPVRETLTLATLFDMYLREVTPDKGERKQQHDRAAADMFLRFYGPGRQPHTLAVQDWKRFIRERREGRIFPCLRKSNQGKRRTLRQVRNRTIDYDLEFLMSVLNWATLAGDGHGNYLLERNPFKGLPVPVEKAPVRAIVSGVEYASLLAAARKMEWRHEVLLVLAHETGHRIGAIRQLRWSDIDMDRGLVHWPQNTDKIGMPHTTKLTPVAFAALEKARSNAATIGDGFVFPSLRDPGNPVGAEYAEKVWNSLQESAGIPHRRGLGFHALRRKFATDFKDAAMRDLMELGGWRNPQTILRCYQAAPTPERQLEILQSRVS